MFKNIKNQVSFPKLESEVLSFWEKQDIFKKSISNREGKKSYVFYDGPPFATGLPHYGHLLASTIKDIVPRYFSMRGYQVKRRFGWDCHGLPVEMEIQKKLDLKSHQAIEDYGVANFNEACREIVLRYALEWEKTIKRLGRWVDFDNDYKTMNKDFMESVWWVFKELYDKGLIYEGFKVLPYSWKAGTILSNFEANLNYKEVDDPALTVKFRSKKNTHEFFLAWTTTPWTLISNLALAVSAELNYLKIKNKSNDEIYYLSAYSFNQFKDKENFVVLEKLRGSALMGKEYEPLFDYFLDEIDFEKYSKVFKISPASFVGENEGVGIVHIAPAYGEEDYELGVSINLPHIDGVNQGGEFKTKVDLVAGENIKVADKKIIKHLKEKGLVFKHETIRHSYPYCWRTDTPLIYKAISTWFVKVENFKDNLIKNNNEIQWLPEHIKQGRFGKWLENAKDWAISRNRFWGTPLPIWKSEEGKIICFGDIASLEKASGEKIDDLHKHFIDKIEIKKDGVTYKRITEVLDCWFESGSMPYAQNHYPFENEDFLEKRFPADFISEGLDQTRGWFYTLLVISTGIFKKPAFKNVVVSGLILAEDGKKMSKSLKNYPDPNFVLDIYGADALRVYLIQSNVIKAETLKFSEKGLKEITKNIMIPLWNSLAFLTTYANMDQWKYEGNENFSFSDLKHPLDRWLFSYKETLVKQVNEAMENYELYGAVPPLVEFINKLTNIYIRRSRKRFWKSEKDSDKREAYLTLYQVLKDFSIVLAPFMPFISEKIYQILKTDNSPESVHLVDYPIFNKKNIDKKLEYEMELVGNVISLGRALRLKHKLKVRQPLKSLTVLSKIADLEKILITYEKMIQDELNVKKIIFSQKEEEYINYSAKIDFKNWGKVLGKNIKAINKKVMKLSNQEIVDLLTQEEEIEWDVDNEKIQIDRAALDIRREGKENYLIISEAGLTCVLDTELPKELLLEGCAREVVNRIQKQRKELDLEYNQKITLSYYSTTDIKEAIDVYGDYISKETLSEKIFFLEKEKIEGTSEKINGVDFIFKIK